MISRSPRSAAGSAANASPPPGRGIARDHPDHPEAPPSARTAPAPMLAAVWCRSVGTTWTLELRALDRGTALGTIVGWISSGVPVSQPAPDTLARELLTARGLRLLRDSCAGLGTHSRHRIGFVCADTELITVADDPKINPSDTTAADRSTDGPGVPRQRRTTENQ